MRKGDETRQEIIRKAAPIFNRKGYSGAALADLMRATGLEKGGIYRHYSIDFNNHLVASVTRLKGGTVAVRCCRQFCGDQVR